MEVIGKVKLRIFFSLIAIIDYFFKLYENILFQRHGTGVIHLAGGRRLGWMAIREEARNE